MYLTNWLQNNDFSLLETNRVKRHDYVRCKLFDGVGCRWYCRALTGQSGGSCDENGDCNCSEEKLEKYVCGGDEVADNTGDALCAGWCQAKGRQTGTNNNLLAITALYLKYLLCSMFFYGLLCERISS